MKASSITSYKDLFSVNGESFSEAEFLQKVIDQSEELIEKLPDPTYKKVLPDPDDEDSPKGCTIDQIWKPHYKTIIVKNIESGKVMAISGQNGILLKQKCGSDYHYQGRYAEIRNGKYCYSKPYIVWDDEKPLWHLLDVDSDSAKENASKIAEETTPKGEGE